MNIYSYFPKDCHKSLFQSDDKGGLIFSGVGNITAKSYLVVDYAHYKKSKNIFWLVNDNKEIYEVKNNLPFWTDRPIAALDHLFTHHQDDYRITETVINLQDQKTRFYLLGSQDAHVKFPSYREVKEQGVVIKRNEEIQVVEFFNQLIRLGYQPGVDVILKKGEYRRSGGVINVFPPHLDFPVKLEVDFEKVAGMWLFDQEKKMLGESLDQVDFLPVNLKEGEGVLLDSLTENDLLVVDDINEPSVEFEQLIQRCSAKKLFLTSFPKNDERYFHLRYLSVLKYYTVFDLLNDLRDKIQRDWQIKILTKRIGELKNIFEEEKISYQLDSEKGKQVTIIDATGLDHIPPSFQNPEMKIQLLTDKEIFNLKKTSGVKGQKVDLDFLTGLRVGDLIVHLDHGIGRFLGVVNRTIDEITREYLEVGYAENDRLFVPVDQADKVSKYVGGEENEPQLTRLGSAEWKTVSQKVKKETQKIAKELLELYAKRAQVKGFNYGSDTEDQRAFESGFPYEETPGQMKAIQDVKGDMNSDRPMDRLVCGDVGFGKTEVAMRAAFKAAQSGKQVAFVSPITILADQHYKSFLKRARGFSVRIEMLSRFKSAAEQRRILDKIRKGEVDIVIGTHRLFQPDVKFLNLGLVIIDEEQRFGVKQKEVFKSMRNQVDILTLTATPIPRTLNLSLNKLRDISIITTPPPGRLPIITEVRRYSDYLVVEAIRKEIDRGGQVYYLHNRVQTIESVAEKLRKLIPEIKFIVAHGQLSPQELEARILKFKEGEVQVLVSSTIIENGIDLPNANTLIVDDAENFGLSQMYQLRGRIGRGKIQAFAYFMYQSRQLRLDAKKRLKAIVDASELGSGFQIAMRDLEIRGAGDILGINQHGSIRVVGISHFLRMLNKTIETLKAGGDVDQKEESAEVSIELPLEAYIPDQYIPDTKDKINVYQRLSSVDDLDLLEDFREDLIAEYGVFSKQVANLFHVLQIKILAKQAGILNVKAITMGSGGKQIVLHLGKGVTAEPIVHLLKHNPKWLVSGDKLKIDMKQLGFNWTEGLKKAIQHLILKSPPSSKT